MLFCRVLMILVSHHDDTFMAGPSPVASPKTKGDREREPYSDDESDKLNNNGGKGRRFYIDVVSKPCHQEQVRSDGEQEGQL